MSPDVTASRGLFVTGGTSGIGLAIALRLARTHDPVHLVSRNASASRSQVEEAFRAHGLRPPRLHDGHVADRARMAQVAAQLTEEGVDIGTVVASAGTAVRALALDVDDDSVRSMLDTNLYGVFVTFQVLAPIVLARPDGRFIALSSVSAIHGQSLRAVYAATKAGVSGLEWGPSGATVNAIGPGILRTNLTGDYMDANPGREQAVLDHSLVGRHGSVDDIAFAAEYLASPECGYVTGQTLIVDGGMSAGSTWW
jgi:3-oxoacyl-[acyl-carrier protein] reductase